MKVAVKYSTTFLFLLAVFAIVIWLIPVKQSLSPKEVGYIEFGTTRFKQFIKKAIVSPLEALNIVKLTIKNKSEQTSKYSTLLYICINNEYHFTHHANMASIISLSGYYVNATTGKVRFSNQGNKRYKLLHIYHSNYFRPKIHQ